MTGSGKIIVGVDGSDCSRRALRWAADEARRRNAQLIPINISPSPLVTHFIGGYPAAHQPEYLDLLRADLSQTVTTVLGPDPQLKIDPAVVRGNPAKVLIDLSADADLLIVGTRGLGGFAGKLLGSVSRDVAAHAHCTTVIVRDTNG